MTVIYNELLIEVFADEGKILDLGDNVYSEYACLPKNYDVKTISEINKEN